MNSANRASSGRVASTALAILLGAFFCHGCASTADNGNSVANQRTFASPDDATSALIGALRSQDHQQLLQIFGADSEDLISSGDPVADQLSADRFLQAYDQKHQLVTNDDGSVTLAIGNDDWPTPIPIVKDSATQAWKFDTAAGKDEVINRRIGRNELTAIKVCKAICDAEKEYAQRDPNGDGVPEYTRHFLSDPGKKNGLYWAAAEGEAPSPLGQLVANAEAAGYTIPSGSKHHRQPYYGYFYRILTTQGPDAPGGALDYDINGKLIGGFAVVAWPAEYGNSGIMTFIANYSGDVYQKDLGQDTDKAARAMKQYDPGPGWQKCE